MKKHLGQRAEYGLWEREAAKVNLVTESYIFIY